MEIVRADKSHIDGILELLSLVHKVHADGRPDLFKEGGIKYTKEQLEEKLDRENEIIFCAVEDEKVLGYVFGVFEHVGENTCFNEDNSLYIDDFCVDKDHQGQKIGKRLYDFVRGYAKEKGFDRVTLHVWECNGGAKLFYDSLGFETYFYAMEDIL